VPRLPVPGLATGVTAGRRPAQTEVATRYRSPVFVNLTPLSDLLGRQPVGVLHEPGLGLGAQGVGDVGELVQGVRDAPGVRFAERPGAQRPGDLGCRGQSLRRVLRRPRGPTSVRVAAASHAAASGYPPARALPVVVLTCGGAWSGCMLDV